MVTLYGLNRLWIQILYALPNNWWKSSPEFEKQYDERIWSEERKGRNIVIKIQFPKWWGNKEDEKFCRYTVCTIKNYKSFKSTSKYLIAGDHHLGRIFSMMLCGMDGIAKVIREEIRWLLQWSFPWELREKRQRGMEGRQEQRDSLYVCLVWCLHIVFYILTWMIGKTDGFELKGNR